MTENVDFFFNDELITVPVTVSGYETRGIFEASDEEFFQGIVSSTRFTVIISVNNFPTVEPGDPITVDSQTFKVNYFSRIDDGKIARIGLSKP